jgi:hypothetical protein
VHCTVEFDEEEMQIIKENDLGTLTVLERKPSAELKVKQTDPPEAFFLRVQHLLDGTDSYYCLGVTEAKMYEKQFMEAMPDLKAYIVVGSGHEEESKTVEF